MLYDLFKKISWKLLIVIKVNDVDWLSWEKKAKDNYKTDENLGKMKMMFWQMKQI